jgi:hypothetical protein
MDINAKTTIPLWAAITSVPAIIGAIMWISFIAYKTDANADTIKSLEASKDKHLELLIKIKEDVAEIKAKIGDK